MVALGCEIAYDVSNDLCVLVPRCKFHKRIYVPCFDDRSCAGRESPWINYNWLDGCICSLSWNLLFRISNLTFRAAEQHRTVQCKLQTNFSSFRSWFLFFRCLLLLLLLRRWGRGLWWLDVMNDRLSLLNGLDNVGNWWGRWEQVKTLRWLSLK